MANRVSAQDLTAYVRVDVAVDLTPYLDDAHLLVEARLAGKGLSEGLLTLIEKNMAAHLYLLGREDGGIVAEKTGESSSTYAGSKTLGAGMSSTRFGQMVLGLDTTGSFASMDKPGRKALFRVVGDSTTPAGERTTDYL